MNRRVVGACALTAGLVLYGCGTTYVDTDVTTIATGPGVTTTTLAPVDPDAPIELLLIEIEELMFDLDERIIDEDGDVAAMDRIDAVWSVAERIIRADDPDDLFNFRQAIELARTGVDRNRPADASKGSKILTDVIDAYLGR